jgi:leucyl-tRNA synthetase
MKCSWSIGTIQTLEYTRFKRSLWFLKKFWNLYFDGDTFSVSDEEPTKAEYKVLHTLIKKVVYDIENFSFNTSVSSVYDCCK